MITATADLADTQRHGELVSEARRMCGRLDRALVAYGTLGQQKSGEADANVALKEITSNFLSTASLLTHLANAFEAQQSGSIAVIGSVAGDRGRQSNYIYGSAKGGLGVFVQGLRHRLAPRGVAVSLIKPGFVDTPMTKPGHSNPEVAQNRLAATPLGRFGTPADIAAGCLYLASDEASWVTGSELVIDGGMTAN